MKYVIIQTNVYQEVYRKRGETERVGRPRLLRTIIPAFGIQDAIEQARELEKKFSGTKEEETMIESRNYKPGAEFWMPDKKVVFTLDELVTISEEFLRDREEGLTEDREAS